MISITISYLYNFVGEFSHVLPCDFFFHLLCFLFYHEINFLASVSNLGNVELFIANSSITDNKKINHVTQKKIRK